MRRQISFGQYRAIDLVIMLIILGVCQYLTAFASSVWFPEQLYVVSPVAGMTALVMMRWSGFGGLHAAIGGVIFTLLSNGGWPQLLIYGAGNLLCLAALVFFKIWGKERVRQSAFLSVMFALCVQVLMWLGRGGIAAVLGHPFEACLGFMTTDILSGLFTLLIIWIVRRIDGLFEDQKQYLLRIQSEQQ